MLESKLGQCIRKFVHVRGLLPHGYYVLAIARELYRLEPAKGEGLDLVAVIEAQLVCSVKGPV